MKELITKAKNEYKEIGRVFCPYFNNYVHFTSKGFKHLIWKRELGKRVSYDIKIRLESIKYIKEIISNSGTLQEYENTYREYFAFISILPSNKYKIVIFKDTNNKYQFFSIIPNYKTGFRDKSKNPPLE